MHSINFYNFEERKDYKQGIDVYKRQLMESDIIMIIWERLQIIYGEKQLLGKQSQRW